MQKIYKNIIFQREYMHLCWKTVKFLNCRDIFCVYLWNHWEFFHSDFFTWKNVKKTIGNVYNILKNIIYSNEKITFNFVKKQKSRISRCFFACIFKTTWNFTISDCFSWKSVKIFMKQSIIVWNKQIFTGKPMHFPIALTNRLCPNPHDGLPLRSESFVHSHLDFKYSTFCEF